MRPRSEAEEPRIRPAGRVADALLVIAALGGLLSVLWWTLSAVLGLGLVSFATGSMSPTYPTGSVAVSVPIALDRVAVGDVVTVQRVGLPPITHRVLAVDVAPSGRSAVVRLKGDANTQPDPTPYDVTALRRVVLPLPPVADALRYAGSPLVVLTVALVIVGSIAYAFWPERIRPRHRESVPHASRQQVGRHLASR
ncbi:S26 family signal peptidase [Amnibacterium kyonggiense]|uniref:Signal peptidase n=1 Tax=Amnibacterium kyonggiense TaxID=595671 RepID=A0A4V3EBG0_9MICO|nr:S26 family signal peptidase [Amnibacterium kyonggiense]TDS81044.1 signal peptidase [Amnibacterium kyonggiense]